MKKIINASLAVTFAAATIAGATAAFAANASPGHDGNLGNSAGHQTISRNSPDQVEKLDYGATGSITTCDKKDAMQHASCFKGLPKLK